MSAPRGQFSSRFGFIMAAAGSAVGLGNIWGFPTQTASNGGAAFVLVYLVLAFVLAYPALMAELVIGRHARANIVTALGGLSHKPWLSRLGSFTGLYGVLTASLILSFYTIVAGWMMSFLAASVTDIAGLDAATAWLTTMSVERNLLFGFLFAALTLFIISSGVQNGIEKWSSRLMPLLVGLLVLLIIYVLMQPGAMEGLRVYLMPDMSRVLEPKLIISAMGQAFFSLSLGVGTMLVYGSYLSKQDSLPRLGAIVTVVDLGIAFIAGLLILPAMFVAKEAGINITDAAGNLIGDSDIIFQVLPPLFDSMGGAGQFVAMAFFALMTIAALTSSISMLEVPVSLAVERFDVQRPVAALAIGGSIFAISAVIIFNFGSLFGWVIDLTTKYSQPLLGVMICLFCGWVFKRNQLLEELKQGHDGLEDGLFWKIWPFYVKLVCPLLILFTFWQSIA
ncbi:sodium-dependent transporter [Simiduia sp. 21SJ11W-1]|uniref:sodium-dependent transporter n=1 Tax=Simiduia sp. 21SJ11W-1 TaxID=2909669 RepID=UPI00209ED4BD|nr:sodium-dependent transporter [Simiduia sp. 21SJ11W-1]UTA47046.1 sodium-dependent transporter [Simiduia sp. 21SJ11W-1]